MKPNAQKRKAILAFKRAVVATFNEGMWREFGYLTDSVEIIEGHRRLLRSLAYGDDDYDGNVMEVLPGILEGNWNRLQELEEFVGVEGWLRENDPSLWDDLYGGGQPHLDDVEQAAQVRGIADLNRHIGRIRRSLLDDPELAVGSAKELLETVLKTIVMKSGRSPEAGDIHDLLKQAQKALNLVPVGGIPHNHEDEIRRRTLSNLAQLVVGVAEIRNLAGTGHGRIGEPLIDITHARLVVNAAAAIATYLLEIWEAGHDYSSKGRYTSHENPRSLP